TECMVLSDFYGMDKGAVTRCRQPLSSSTMASGVKPVVGILATGESSFWANSELDRSLPSRAGRLLVSSPKIAEGWTGPWSRRTCVNPPLGLTDYCWVGSALPSTPASHLSCVNSPVLPGFLRPWP